MGVPHVGTPPEDVDVVVVGAGPTGLLLAGDLAECGVRCAVVERHPTGSGLTRAFAVHARTLEQLDARGLADELSATGTPVRDLRLLGRVRLDLGRLPSRFPHVLITPQYETERVLGARVDRLGVPVLRGREVTGLTQDGAGVRVATRDADGRPGELRARWLVGCDGVRSAVRDAVGLPFPGRSAVRSVVLADVRLAREPDAPLVADSCREGFAFLVPFGDGWWRVIAWDRRDQQPDDAPVDLDRLRDVVRRSLGADLGLHDPRWTSRFHSDERQAPTYRVGRVLLAGDAAHVHSPAGGQGMNTGLQDAAALSWRLAAVVRGAPEALLDDYTAERHPVGRQVLRASGLLLRMAMAGAPVRRRVRDALLAAALGVPAAADRVAGRVSGLGVRYGRRGPVGRRVPDLPLAGPGPTRLYEALRGRRFLVVVPPGTAAPDLGDDGAGADLVVSPAATATLLVRPDGYLGAVGGAAALRAVLRRSTGRAARDRVGAGR